MKEEMDYIMYTCHDEIELCVQNMDTILVHLA